MKKVRKMLLKSILTVSRRNVIFMESIIILLSGMIFFNIINKFRTKNQKIPAGFTEKYSYIIALILIIINFGVRILLEIMGIGTSFIMFLSLQVVSILQIHLHWAYNQKRLKNFCSELLDLASIYRKDYQIATIVLLAYGLVFQILRILEITIDTTLLTKQMKENLVFTLIVLITIFLLIENLDKLVHNKLQMDVVASVRIPLAIVFFCCQTLWTLIILVYGLITKKAPFSVYGFGILIVIFIIGYKVLNFYYLKQYKEEFISSVKAQGNIQPELKTSVDSQDAILSVRDLVTYFYTDEGIVKAVEGVSFDIYKEEILGLVGETGCGKSVTALSILQLVRSPGKILSGKVLFHGEDLLQKTEEEMLEYRGNKITMMFQDPLNSINPVLTIGDQLAEVFINHQSDRLNQELVKAIEENETLKKKYHTLVKIEKKLKGKAKEETKKKIEVLKQKIRRNISISDIANKESQDLLEKIGFPNPDQLLKRYPHELSGGMRQRIMIAMGLACNPELLLADEPTTALDVTIQAQILDLILNLKKQFHTSVLFITHDLGVISSICDRVAVMYSGYIVEYGEVEKIFREPKHPYTIGLINSIPKIDKKEEELTTIPGSVPNLIFPPSGCRFHPRCKHCFEPCKTKVPKQFEVTPNHFVSCHLYDQRFSKNQETKEEID